MTTSREAGVPGEFRSRREEIVDFLKDTTIAIPGSTAGAQPQEVKFSESDIKRMNLAGLEPVEHYPLDTLRRIIPSNFANNVQQLDIAPARWKRAVLHAPQLLYTEAPILKQKIATGARLLGVDRAVYLKAALLTPTVFTRKPESMRDRLQESANQIGMSEKKFFELAVRHPPLMSLTSDRLTSNVDGSVKVLGIDRGIFLSAAESNPALFTYRPETLDSNAESLANLLGVPKAELTHDLLSKRSSLLLAAPETVRNRLALYERLAVGSRAELLLALRGNLTTLTAAPEKILELYALAKLQGRPGLSVNELSRSPDRVAAQTLPPNELARFKQAREYFRDLSKRRRTIKRTVGGKVSEEKAYRSHAAFVEKYFGDKGEVLDTQGRQYVDNLVARAVSQAQKRP